MNNNDKKFMAEKIRTQYMEKHPGELDELRALDARVKRPANIFAYIFGSLGAIIMGSGMSLVMTDIGSSIGMTDALIPGIAIGLIGMAIAVANYPIFKSILTARRKKYAPQIIELSEKIVNE